MKELLTEILNLYEYDSYITFTFSPNTLRIIFIFVWIGIILAMLGSFYSNYYLGSFILKLTEAGADCAENAKTLEELGAGRSFMLTRSLREGSVLRKTVLTAPAAEVDLSNKQSSMCRYYIPKEKQETAKKRFRVRGNGVVSLLIWIGVITVVLLLLLVYGPWLFGIIDSFLASV